MGEAVSTVLMARTTNAIELVNAALASEAAFTIATRDEIPRPLTDCLTVWRQLVTAMDKEWTVYVGLSHKFPDEIPIACIGNPEGLHLRNPHVDADGSVCTIPDSAAIDSNDPIGLVRRIFDDVTEILQDANADDFRTEFSSYWSRSITDKRPAVVVIDEVESFKNPFHVAFRTDVICIASSAEKIKLWVSRQMGKPQERLQSGVGVAIHLSAPLVPSTYPATLAHLTAIAAANDAEACAMLQQQLCGGVEKGLALLVQKEGEGVSLGAVEFTGLGLSKSKRTELVRGFRAGTVPPNILLSRAVSLVSAMPVARRPVVRVDHKWVHSRGGDGRDLADKSVLVIGCGSLGGYVAHLLSRSGVGRLTLTDNDQLGWHNLGRHILGASSIGHWKAEALAEKLRGELPHLNVTGIPKDWRDAIAENAGLFEGHNLIISTVADWRCERPLNELAKKGKIPPVVFGWLEPHAVAGQCLATVSSGGCFLCGATRFGHFVESVSQFERSQLSKEPGGCTNYQHYGPTALLPIASMISSTVVDSLLNPPAESFLTTWVSSDDHFKSVRAGVTDAWAAKIGESGYSKIYRQQWIKAKTCALCRTTTQ